PGMVGSISANYIVEQMHMRQISYVESEFIMPAVIYIDGNLRHPYDLLTQMTLGMYAFLYARYP
ncbi:MAG: PAC2 family protein, partial [Candidatus Nitrosopolaris sp.]